MLLASLKISYYKQLHQLSLERKLTNRRPHLHPLPGAGSIYHDVICQFTSRNKWKRSKDGRNPTIPLATKSFPSNQDQNRNLHSSPGCFIVLWKQYTNTMQSSIRWMLPSPRIEGFTFTLSPDGWLLRIRVAGSSVLGVIICPRPVINLFFGLG